MNVLSALLCGITVTALSIALVGFKNTLSGDQDKWRKGIGRLGLAVSLLLAAILAALLNK